MDAPGRGSEQAVEALDALLSAERAAARVADAERLLALQAEKAALLQDLDLSGAAPAELERLAARARANLPLLRELVALHRSLVGAAGPTYGQDGGLTSPGPAPRVHRSG